ncbi:MAG: hypothetical protein ONB42_21610, partial [candidate division KSB1 bacterium]|nr:hypothetical protein [candidate division KSB1 bacterium]
MRASRGEGIIKHSLARCTVSSVLLILAPAARAPSQVTSITPAQGNTNVSSGEAFAIFRRTRLGTSFRFGDLDVPIHIEFYPDTAFSPPQITTSRSDLRTIYF